MGKLITESSDLRSNLEHTEHNLQAKVAEISVLETQQEELNRRLAVRLIYKVQLTVDHEMGRANIGCAFVIFFI